MAANYYHETIRTKNAHIITLSTRKQRKKKINIAISLEYMNNIAST